MALRGSLRYYEPTHQQWVHSLPKTYDGSRWRVPSGLDTMTLRYSPYDPYIGRGSIWQRDVSAMPLATNSAIQANWIATHLNYGSGWGETSLNPDRSRCRGVIGA